MIQSLYRCYKDGHFQYECDNANVSLAGKIKLRNYIQFTCHYHNIHFTIKYNG
jgi:hypothetical protein